MIFFRFCELGFTSRLSLIFLFQKSGGPVTCVKIVSSVDYMLAFGDSKGIISIFIIPKEKPIFSSENSAEKNFSLLADQSVPLKNTVCMFSASKNLYSIFFLAKCTFGGGGTV